MKPEKQQQTLNKIITQAYHSRCSSWKPSSKAEIAWDFSTLLLIKWLVNAMPLKSDFQWLWQANPIKKPAMNNKTILKAAVFHFVRPVEKDS